MFGAIGEGTIVKNFNLDRVEIKSHVDSSIIGIICGYANGGISGIGVYNRILTVTSGKKVSSEYSLMGETGDTIQWSDLPTIDGGSESGTGGELVIYPKDLKI